LPLAAVTVAMLVAVLVVAVPVVILFELGVALL
jgi:hypothetical protein